MIDFHTPYTDMLNEELKRILQRASSPSKVLHRATCPCCNKKLVNLYFSYLIDGYICKECWDVLKRRDENV